MFFFHFDRRKRRLTKDVSSVVGTLWRCGVQTTLGGIAGIGVGHLLGREHDSTPQSGVEAPRLKKRSQIVLLLRLLWLLTHVNEDAMCLSTRRYGSNWHEP